MECQKMQSCQVMVNVLWKYEAFAKVAKQWAGQDCKGHSAKVSRQKVKMESQCTGSMSDWYALKIWSSWLAFIVSVIVCLLS